MRTILKRFNHKSAYRFMAVAVFLSMAIAMIPVSGETVSAVELLEEDNMEQAESQAGYNEPPIVYTADLDNDMSVIARNGAETIMGDYSIKTGLLLFPGQSLDWSNAKKSKRVAYANVSVNNQNTCHNHDDSPLIHSTYVGFTFESGKSGYVVESLGNISKGEYEIVSGGEYYGKEDERNTLTYEEITVDDSFTATNYPVMVKYSGTPSSNRHATKCIHNNEWDVWTCGSGSGITVVPIVNSNVSVKFDYPDDVAGSGETSMNLALASGEKNYTYEKPVKIGYTFDGFEFTDKNGKSIRGIVTDSGDGSITFAPLTADNFNDMSNLSEDGGITAKPQWKEKVLTLSFYPDGGVIKDDVKIVTENNVSYGIYSEKTDFFPTPTKTGYRFDGWYIGDNKVTKISEIAKDDWNEEQVYNFTAHWTLVEDPGYSLDVSTLTVTVRRNGCIPNEGWVDKVKHLVIENGVTQIAERAVYSWTGLETIVIPNSVTAIGNSAFSYCTSLKSVTLPNNLKKIEDNTFNNCRALETVDIPKSVESIGKGAFYRCDQLKTVVIPSKVTVIEENTFNSCYGLTEYSIPDGIETIGREAFANCTNLKKIKLPDTLKTIGSYAFYQTKLSSVVIPNSVTEFGDAVFYWCSDLKEIVYYGTEAEWNQIRKGRDNDVLNKTPVTYHTHKGTLVKEKAATCTADGCKAYYICSCDGKFEDENCTKKITDMNSLKINRLGHDFGTNNETCSRCKTKNPNYKPGGSGQTGQEEYVENKKAVKADDGSKATTTGSGEAAIAEVQKTAKKSITVPETVKINGVDYAVTTINANAFKNAAKATTVTLPKTVTKINANAFAKSKISKVNITIQAGAKLTVNKKAFKKSKVTSIQITMSKKDKKKKDSVIKSFTKAGIKKNKIKIKWK